MSSPPKQDTIRKLIHIFLDVPHNAFVDFTRSIERATGASPFIIWLSVMGFVFVVSLVYMKVSQLTLSSKKEIPLEDCVGHKENVTVFLDIGVVDRFKDELIGRVEIELFTKTHPVTTENFRCFCTGEKGEGSIKGRNMHYKGVKLHRIIPGFMIQGGDHIQNDGSGGESIYGRCFDDEWPDDGHVKHSKGGLLSMANSGPHTNGSQFFLTFAKTKWLDGRHVVFGRVTKGMEHVRWIEMRCGTYTGQPLQNVIIQDCGEIKGKST